MVHLRGFSFLLHGEINGKKAEYDLYYSKGGRLCPKRFIDDIPQVQESSLVQESGHWTAMNRMEPRQIVFNRFRVVFLGRQRTWDLKSFLFLQLCAKGWTSFVGFGGQLSKLHIFHTTSVKPKLFDYPRDVNLVMIGMFIEFDPKSIDGCYLSDVSPFRFRLPRLFHYAKPAHAAEPGRFWVHLIIVGIVWV